MTVSKQKNLGTWQFSVYLKDEKGNKVRKRGYGYTTKSQAVEEENKIIEKYAPYQHESNGNSSITLQELYTLYEDNTKDSKSPTSIRIDRYNMDTVYEFFGKDKIVKDITQIQVQEFRKWLEKKYDKKMTIISKTMNIKKVCNYGIKLDLLSKNPFEYINDSLSKNLGKTVKNVWSLEDYDKFAKAIDKTNYYDFRFYVLITLLFNTGMRVNECLSLQWTKLDGDTIHINEQVRIDDGNVVFAPLKTQSSVRDIFIPPYVKALLDELKSRTKARTYAYHDEWFIFGNSKPLILHLINNKLHKLCEELNIPRITTHCLRHSHASILLSKGIDVAYVSKRLGHNNISTTLNVYTHYIQAKTNDDNALLTKAMQI